MKTTIEDGRIIELTEAGVIRQIADSLLEEERFDDALAVLTEAIETEPDEPHPHFLRARAHHGLGQLEAALRDVETAIELSGEEPNYWGLQGRLHRELGKLEEAQRDFERAEELDTGVRYLVELGRLWYAQEDYSQALEMYAKAANIDPSFEDLHFEKGKTELRLGLYEAAVQSFSMDIDGGEPTAVSYFNRHAALRELGRFDEALRDVEEVIRREPEGAAGFVARAAIRERIGDSDGARSDWRQAIVLDPAHAAAHYSLGAHQLLAGDAPAAINQWNQALRSDPDHVPSLNGRSILLIQDARFQEGIADLDRLVDLQSDEPRYPSNRGWAYESLGQFEQALDDYRAALEIDAEYEPARRNLVALLRRLNRDDEADREEQLLPEEADDDEE